MRETFKILFLIAFAFLCAQVEPSTNTLSYREAKTMAAKAARNSSFPIVMNADVYRELKFQLRPGHRKHLKDSFKRMKKYEKTITKKLAKNKLPKALLAIPLVESGYQNIHSQFQWGSGLWMFIKPTAKAYGLKVTEKVDQRLDVNKSTDAAIKYIKANHKKLKDWQLTVLAYNIGENKVLQLMKKAKTKNAWEIDNGYLAKVMAAMIILSDTQK